MESTFTVSKTLRFLLPLFWPPPQNQPGPPGFPSSLGFGGWGEPSRLTCWEASGCTVPFVRLCKLIMLIGALRFLKPATLNTAASSLAEPNPGL